MALHFDRGDRGRIKLERTFNAFAGRDLADDEGRVEPAVAAGDHNTFKRLSALVVAFNHVDENADSVAGLEVRVGLTLADAFDFFLFQFVDEIHL